MLTTAVPLKRRALHAPGFALTERDTVIVEAVYRYRMLERRQVEQLFFSTRGTNTNRARERLRLLYQHGYLERVARPVYSTTAHPGPVYRLALRGAQLVAERTGLPLRTIRYWGRGDDRDSHQTRVGEYFLTHGLALADVRIAIEQSAVTHGLTIRRWQDELGFRHTRDRDAVEVILADGDSPRRIPILPDGYFVIETPKGTGHFFLEVDLGSEPINRAWRQKLFGYKAYLGSGAFHARYGITDPSIGFRVLTTTPSKARATNLKAAAERYGDPALAPLFLFTPLGAVTRHDPLRDPLWLRGGRTGHYSVF
jgi:hypothetical protein